MTPEYQIIIVLVGFFMFFMLISIHLSEQHMHLLTARPFYFVLYR
jgi:hypothetical protein